MSAAAGTGAPVVVGVDGSSSARDAVRWGARAAEVRRAPLLLVTSQLGPESCGAGVPPGFFEFQEAAAQRHLVEAAEAATAECPGVAVETIVHTAPAIPALLTHSTTARLLVIGARGHGELGGGLLGSVTVAVATHAHCPVVVVRGAPEAGAPAPTGPVVVGVDGSANSAPALGAAYGEASWRGVDLVAVHAWTDLSLAAVYALDSNATVLDTATLRAGQDAVLAESLAGWADTYPDVTVRRVVVEDRPVRHLLAESAGAQLLVVGSHGRGGFASMLLGSTSRALLQAADVPLMIVRGPR